ncbi:MAG: universal stress protein [Rubrobacter sp.]|nr:universal stress protein [Rubrobacter sp.]
MSIFPTSILVATDGSEEAALAGQTAADIAQNTGSELYVLYVEEDTSNLIPAYGPYMFLSPEKVKALIREAHSLATQTLDEQVAHIEDAGGRVSGSCLRHGGADQEIVKLADEIGAGLIVMGSRGLGGIRRALMGSVSDSVVRHAHCPVLIVRREAAHLAAKSSARVAGTVTTQLAGFGSNAYHLKRVEPAVPRSRSER